LSCRHATLPLNRAVGSKNPTARIYSHKSEPPTLLRPSDTARWGHWKRRTHSSAARCNPRPPLTSGPHRFAIRAYSSRAAERRERKRKRYANRGERNPRSRRLAFIRSRGLASPPPRRPPSRRGAGGGRSSGARAVAEAAAGARGKGLGILRRRRRLWRGGCGGCGGGLLGELARSLAAALRIEVLRPLNRGSGGPPPALRGRAVNLPPPFRG
jgi:hypothetical protein